ncbi:hypothetical protein GR157_19595 [Burkholderia sp. 4701]|nr:hypothetical protein [Burkholderia sp. 4701]MXN83870.1 hypothetical protein [Burkholderia sp. 4812]
MNLNYVCFYVCRGIYEFADDCEQIMLAADHVTVRLLGFEAYASALDNFLAGGKQDPSSLSKSKAIKRNSYLAPYQRSAIIGVEVNFPLGSIDRAEISGPDGIDYSKLPHKKIAVAAFRSVAAALALTRSGRASSELDFIVDGFYAEDKAKNFHQRLIENSIFDGPAMTRVSDGEIEDAAKLSLRLHEENRFKTIVTLLSDAQTPYLHGRLCSFVAAWSGLEVLVNKKFTELESNLREIIAKSGLHEVLSGRILSVMSGKYRILDKFIVLAASFNLPEIESDIAEFKKIKDDRDKFFHSMKIDIDDLPLEEARDMLEKYLRLSLGSATS